MEHVNRILEIMGKSGLTPSEFADKIDVQRSAISHITSGRNKPSLEFLIKIKNAFPEIDTDWLIFGVEKEEIFEEKKDESPTPISEIQPNKNISPSLFDEEKLSENSANLNASLNFQNDEKSTSEIISAKNTSAKKIIRVVVFYADGTFEDFTRSENL